MRRTRGFDAGITLSLLAPVINIFLLRRGERTPRPSRARRARGCGIDTAGAPAAGRSGEESDRANLDAFAGPRIGRRGRIIEVGLSGPARPPVLQRIEHLEDKRLVAAHAREPIPAVLRIVSDGVGLADAVRVAALGDNEVLGRHAARI